MTLIHIKCWQKNAIILNFKDLMSQLKDLSKSTFLALEWQIRGGGGAKVHPPF